MSLLTLGSLLDDLDPDLLRELDHVVRDNQLSRCPFVRSGRAELILHDRYPDLARDIEEERQIRVKELAYKSVQKDDERKMSTSFRTRFGSLDDLSGISPTPERRAKVVKPPRNEPFSPSLRPKDSQADLMFDMEDDASLAVGSPLSPSARAHGKRLAREDTSNSLPRAGDATSPTGEGLVDHGSMDPQTPPASFGRRTSTNGSPWAASTIPTARLDLRQVLAEPKAPQSALSAGLAAQQAESSGKGPVPQKISQKERKRRQQQQAEDAARQEESTKAQPHQPWTAVGDKKAAPWKKAAPAPPVTSLKGMLEANIASPAAPPIKPLVAAEASSSSSTPRRTASPDTRFPGQKSTSSNNAQQSSSQLARAEAPPLVPHSKSYIKKVPKLEQELGLGLADIIGQQKREQQSVKEAVAKRSLQEIQQEQEFQEWWDLESRRMQEEEQARLAIAMKASEGGAKRGRGGKSRGGGRRNTGAEAEQSAEGGSGSAQQGGDRMGGDDKAGKKTGEGKPGRGRGRGGRGRGDGGGGGSGGGSKSMPIRQTSKA